MQNEELCFKLEMTLRIASSHAIWEAGYMNPKLWGEARTLQTEIWNHPHTEDIKVMTLDVISWPENRDQEVRPEILQYVDIEGVGETVTGY